MSCPNCNQEIPNTAKVCGYCGYKLKAVPVSPPTPPSVTASAPETKTGVPVWIVGGCAGIGVLIVIGIFLMFLLRPRTPELPVQAIEPPIIVEEPVQPTMMVGDISNFQNLILIDNAHDNYNESFPVRVEEILTNEFGYSVAYLNSADQMTDTLGTASLFIIFEPAFFDESDIDILVDYVAGGGGLLVIDNHYLVTEDYPFPHMDILNRFGIGAVWEIVTDADTNLDYADVAEYQYIDRDFPASAQVEFFSINHVITQGLDGPVVCWRPGNLIASTNQVEPLLEPGPNVAFIYPYDSIQQPSSPVIVAEYGTGKVAGVADECFIGFYDSVDYSDTDYGKYENYGFSYNLFKWLLE